jgi:hypothetical protein
MAYIFGDGFDIYATTGDAAAGYWDAFVNGAAPAVANGRFAGSQSWKWGATGAAGWLIKNSGANDAVHHIVVSFYSTAAISGSVVATYLQFADGATGQCAIGFRSDGAIILASGSSLGTVLATYTGAFPLSNTWYAFEFEVVINNTTGRFRVRKNGNTIDDFDSGAVLNTRGGTANNYANRLVFGGNASSVNSHFFDDMLWRSDAASVPFVGDVRCYTRAPLATVSQQFANNVASYTLSNGFMNASGSDATGVSRYTPFSSTYGGTFSTFGLSINTGFTGNLKCAIFLDNGSSNPGAVVASANTLVNPVTGINTITFPTPVTLAKNTPYWIGVSHDVTASMGVINPGGFVARTSAGVSYASFPVANPGSITGGQQPQAYSSLTITTNNNADFVNETLEDQTTSYVYSSNPGDADFYTVGPLAQTPASVIAVITRGFIQKSDAGTRLGAVQLKSGGTTVATPNAVMGTTFGWVYRIDANDPATGLPWTHTAVSAVNIGPLVIS